MLPSTPQKLKKDNVGIAASQPGRATSNGVPSVIGPRAGMTKLAKLPVIIDLLSEDDEAKQGSVQEHRRPTTTERNSPRSNRHGALLPARGSREDTAHRASVTAVPNFAVDVQPKAHVEVMRYDQYMGAAEYHANLEDWENDINLDPWMDQYADYGDERAVQFGQLPPGYSCQPQSMNDAPRVEKHDSKEECIAQILDFFPGICPKYVTEVYDTISPVTEVAITHILDQKSYPKAKDVQNKLKRKREVDEDEEIVRKFGAANRDMSHMQVLMYAMLALLLLHIRLVISLPVPAHNNHSLVARS